jgi:two-component system probable response regulator PhcQ
VGVQEPAVDWHRWDPADLQQAEARRGAGVALQVRSWLERFGARQDDARALAQLAGVLGGEVRGGVLHLARPEPCTALLTAPAGGAASAEDCAWLAWQIWTQGRFGLQVAGESWVVAPATDDPLPKDWLADAMDRLGGQA